MSHAKGSSMLYDHYLFCPHCGRHIKDPLRRVQLILGGVLLVEVDHGISLDAAAGRYTATHENVAERVRGLISQDTYRRTLPLLVSLGYLEKRKEGKSNYYAYRLSQAARSAPGFVEEILSWSRACTLPTQVTPQQIQRAIIQDR